MCTFITTDCHDMQDTQTHILASFATRQLLVSEEEEEIHYVHTASKGL